jgi:hypothetical protein
MVPTRGRASIAIELSAPLPFPQGASRSPGRVFASVPEGGRGAFRKDPDVEAAIVKAADIRRLAEEHVLALLPGEAVQVRGRVVLPPVEFLLRAFVFESSPSSGSYFHVHALVEPLYAPEEQAAGTARTLSPRLVYEDGLDGGQAGELRHWLQSEALPLLERIRRPGQLADEIERRERGFPFNGRRKRPEPTR